MDCAKVWATVRELGISAQTLYSDWPDVVNSVNSWLLQRFEQHLADIIKNLESDIRYQKLEKRRSDISASNPLVKSYFHRLQNGSILLCNGFIPHNQDITKDIAAMQQWNYFRRAVVIWSDSVKLRYGARPEDCPRLWERMEKYVVSMARIFKGFRLDNAHGTALAVSAYLLTQARKANPSLFLIAELFTGSADLDALYVSRLGINLLIREAMTASSPRELSGWVYRYGNGEIKSVGCVEPCAGHAESLIISPYEQPATVLVPTATPALFYDCTHDNMTPAQARTAMDALPNAAIVCFTPCAVASTRGYDELLPVQLSTAKEMRLYRLIVEQLEDNASIPMEKDFLGISLIVEYVDVADEEVGKVEIKGSWDDWQQSVELE